MVVDYSVLVREKQTKRKKERNEGIEGGMMAYRKSKCRQISFNLLSLTLAVSTL